MTRLSLSSLERRWDVAIVGAGPAGALSAYLLARENRRVLLVDHAAFPRDKVCGGCLNAAAMEVLRSCGLGHVPGELGAVPIHGLRLRIGRTRLEVDLPTGAAVSRRSLDDALVRAAIAQGAIFLDGVSARLGTADSPDSRALLLQRRQDQARIDASLVLACDGLRGRLMDDEPGCAWRITPRSRIGVSAIADRLADDWPPGHIHMAVGAGGYVGAVRIEDGRVNLAAALDPGACREAGGPQPVIASILRACGSRAPADLRWTGTGLLTRRRKRLGSHRVIAVGDACGYVEPFTGEGMAWALASARAAADFVETELAAGPREHLAERWTTIHARLLSGRRTTCRALTLALRYPTLAAGLLWAAGWVPGAVHQVVDAINQPLVLTRSLHDPAA